MVALAEGHGQVVEVLLKRGADPFQPDMVGTILILEQYLAVLVGCQSSGSKPGKQYNNIIYSNRYPHNIHLPTTLIIGHNCITCALHVDILYMHTK